MYVSTEFVGIWILALLWCIYWPSVKCVTTDCCLDAFDSSSNGGRPNRTRLSNILMQLRKCVAHPYLFDGMHHIHIEEIALVLLTCCIGSSLASIAEYCRCVFGFFLYLLFIFSHMYVIGDRAYVNRITYWNFVIQNQCAKNWPNFMCHSDMVVDGDNSSNAEDNNDSRPK